MCLISTQIIEKLSGPENLEMLDALGTGTFGVVRLCRVQGIARPFSIKTLSKDQLLEMAEGNEDKMAACIMSERRIFEQVKHPFIVTL